MTAGRNKNISFLFCEHAFIFLFDDRCTECRFLCIVKAEFFQRSSHAFDACTFIIRNKRRRKADDDRITALQENTYFFRTVYDLFCVLRANNEALTAKNTFIADDMRMIPRETNRLYRAMADAFIAIFAV